MSKQIIVALIGAAATIGAALLGSNWLVDNKINNLKVTLVLESKTANHEYEAAESGFVSAVATADSIHPSVAVEGFINGELIAATGAQDSNVKGVPSIGSNSFTMPVPKDTKWIVKTASATERSVVVKWFANRPDTK
ncbi:MAG: hypothetical protein QOF24_1831 [Verrucomicrobiota bacterium]|jgi:hypothetical protein